MHHAEQRTESMLFHYETTNRADYRHVDFHEYKKSVYKSRPTLDKQNTPVYKSIHTLTAWKGDMPPFSISHRPKDLIRTNPNDIQQPFYDELVDHHREEVQKTRPRLVMTPAISMDDITDPIARNLLINDMYTSNTTRALKEGVGSIKYNNVKAPLPGRPAPSNPIFLQKFRPPLVSPEWRMDSVSWDQNQLRGYCNPTKIFWLKQGIPESKMCLRDLKRGNR